MTKVNTGQPSFPFCFKGFLSEKKSEKFSGSKVVNIGLNMSLQMGVNMGITKGVT